MRRLRRAALGLLIGALVVPLGGCDWAAFNIRISDFDSSLVEGISLWRVDARGNPVERTYEVVLEAPYIYGAGEEWLEYSVQRVDTGERLFEAHVRLQRDLTDPDRVTLHLLLARNDGSPLADYGLSVFNASGDSALTLNTIQF